MNEEIKRTQRGFSFIEKEDLYGAQYSVQESSLATDNAIWLGIDNANPRIMAKEVDPDLTGWVKCPMPDGVLFNTRMHLNREMAKELIDILQVFVDTGELG